MRYPLFALFAWQGNTSGNDLKVDLEQATLIDRKLRTLFTRLLRVWLFLLFSVVCLPSLQAHQASGLPVIYAGTTGQLPTAGSGWSGYGYDRALPEQSGGPPRSVTPHGTLVSWEVQSNGQTTASNVSPNGWNVSTTTTSLDFAEVIYYRASVSVPSNLANEGIYTVKVRLKEINTPPGVERYFRAEQQFQAKKISNGGGGGGGGGSGFFDVRTRVFLSPGDSKIDVTNITLEGRSWWLWNGGDPFGNGDGNLSSVPYYGAMILYKRTQDFTYTPIATINQDVFGRYKYTDTNLVNGTEYCYYALPANMASLYALGVYWVDYEIKCIAPAADPTFTFVAEPDNLSVIRGGSGSYAN